MSKFFKKLAWQYKTPLQVQKLINSFEYNRNDTQKSAVTAFKTKSVHCLEAALLCAAILENHGYPPLVMSLESQDNLDHVIFIFKSKNKWGSVSQSRDQGLKGRAPVYRTFKDLAWSYFDPYIDLTGRITAFQMANLDDIKGVNWRMSKNNVWYVEDYLIELKHIPLKSSNKRYKKYHARYKKKGDLAKRKNWW